MTPQEYRKNLALTLAVTSVAVALVATYVWLLFA
jgi:hypothetical protein